MKQERLPEKTSKLKIEATGSTTSTSAIGPFILVSFDSFVFAAKFVHLLSSKKQYVGCVH